MNESGIGALSQRQHEGVPEPTPRTAVPGPKSGFTSLAQTSLSEADFPHTGVWTEGALQGLGNF